jgi:hypothetical protein
MMLEKTLQSKFQQEQEHFRLTEEKLVQIIAEKFQSINDELTRSI